MSSTIATPQQDEQSSQVATPASQISWKHIVEQSKETSATCHAINEKGRKCTRRCKENTNYCGKHKEANDHTFDSYITVTLQILDDIPYYVDKNGIVFNYSLENIQMVGYIEPTTQKLVRIDFDWDRGGGGTYFLWRGDSVRVRGMRLEVHQTCSKPYSKITI